jgi:hypothetical protein
MSDNINLEPRTYLTAQALASNQAAAIERAINFYFQDQEWNEDDLAELAGMTHHSNGVEVFSIDDTPLVEFSAPTSMIEIDDGQFVEITYTMEIQELYK